MRTGHKVNHACSNCVRVDVVPVGSIDPKQIHCPHSFRWEPTLGSMGMLVCCGCDLRVDGRYRYFLHVLSGRAE